MQPRLVGPGTAAKAPVARRATGLAPWPGSIALAAIALLMAACGEPGPGRPEEGERVGGEAAPQEGEVVAGHTAAAVNAPLTGYDTVFAYFTAPDETPSPVARPVPDTAPALRAAFEALLRGPTHRERAAGLHSWFSPATAGMLRSVSLREGSAVVDFRDLRPVIPNAVSSAGALMLMGELSATAFQFPGIQRVEFRIHGSCEALMSWLQLGCHSIVRSDWEPPAGYRMAERAGEP